MVGGGGAGRAANAAKKSGIRLSSRSSGCSELSLQLRWSVGEWRRAAPSPSSLWRAWRVLDSALLRHESWVPTDFSGVQQGRHRKNELIAEACLMCFEPKTLEHRPRNGATFVKDCAVKGELLEWGNT